MNISTNLSSKEKNGGNEKETFGNTIHGTIFVELMKREQFKTKFIRVIISIEINVRSFSLEACSFLAAQHVIRNRWTVSCSACVSMHVALCSVQHTVDAVPMLLSTLLHHNTIGPYLFIAL